MEGLNYRFRPPHRRRIKRLIRTTILQQAKLVTMQFTCARCSRDFKVSKFYFGIVAQYISIIIWIYYKLAPARRQLCAVAQLFYSGTITDTWLKITWYLTTWDSVASSSQITSCVFVNKPERETYNLFSHVRERIFRLVANKILKSDSKVSLWVTQMSLNYRSYIEKERLMKKIKIKKTAKGIRKELSGRAKLFLG